VNVDVKVYYGKSSLYRLGNSIQLTMEGEHPTQVVPCEYSIFLVVKFTEDSNSGFFLEYRQVNVDGLPVRDRQSKRDGAVDIDAEKRLYAICFVVTCCLAVMIGVTYICIQICSSRLKNIEQLKV